MLGHIITPEGREVASDNKQWASMPSDWREFACFLECPNCPTEKGKAVDHAAGSFGEYHAEPFTDHDWDGYAGAEAWDNGDRPVRRHFQYGTVVADKSGISLDFEDGETYMWNTPLATQALAMAVINGFDHNMTSDGAKAMGLEAC